MNNLGPDADAGIMWTKNSGLLLLAWGSELPMRVTGAPGSRQVGAVLNCLLLGLCTEPTPERSPRPAKLVWDMPCTTAKPVTTECGQEVVGTTKDTQNSEPAHVEGREGRLGRTARMRPSSISRVGQWCGQKEPSPGVRPGSSPASPTLGLSQPLFPYL